MGQIAREIGIKPESAEFHALKRGDFMLTGTPGDRAQGKDKGKTSKNANRAAAAKNHGRGKSKIKEHGHGKGHGQ